MREHSSKKNEGIQVQNDTKITTFIYALSFLTLTLFVFSKNASGSEEKLQISLVPSKTAFSSGDTIIFALKVKIPPKHHLYGNPLGPGIGKPLSLRVDGATQVKWVDVKKMDARKFKPSIGDWVWAYEQETYFFIRGIAPGGISGSLQGTIYFDGLICHTACIPVSEKIPFSVQISPEKKQKLHFSSDSQIARAFKHAVQSMQLAQPEKQQSPSPLAGINLSPQQMIVNPQVTAVQAIPQWDYSPVERKVEFNLWLAILFGFLAGIILNAMPCVLPVLGVKILSFSQARESSRKAALMKSLAFSAGMISVFMILASLASFANFSWGEQFQNPKVLVGIIALIVVFALGMFDVFMIMVPGSIGGLEKKSGSGLTGDFLKGMFATVLATPCSGPLLGATLAWTLTQSPQVVFTVFASIGAGMAFPYVLFSASSTLSKLIPKPGPWMNDFKMFTGFVLLGMAVYLMIGLPSDMIVSTIGLCVSLAFAVVVYTRYAPWGSSVPRKITMLLIAGMVVGSGIYVNFGILYKNTSDQALGGVAGREWKPFSPEALREAHANGRHVVIDFTANWCMNCQYNKVAVLNTPEINELIQKKQIVALRADLTRPDPRIETLLEHLGSRSVPFLAVFPGDTPYEPVVMRDLLNKKNLLKVLGDLQD